MSEQKQSSEKPFLTLAKEELMQLVDDQLPAAEFPEEFRSMFKRELWQTGERLLKQSYFNAKGNQRRR